MSLCLQRKHYQIPPFPSPMQDQTDLESITTSLTPISIIPQEMPHHIEGSLRVMRGQQMSSPIHQNKP